MTHSGRVVFRVLTLAFVLIASGFLTFSSSLNAQLPVVQLRGAFPPGGTVGTEVTVQVTDGSDLEELSGLSFSDRRIEVINPPDPATNPRAFQVRIPNEVPPGYYAIRAVGRFGISNDRLFRVESIPTSVYNENAWKETPTVKIEVDHAVYSRLESASDVDTFTATLTAGTPYEIRVDCLSLDSSMSPVIEVYAPNDKRVAFGRRIRFQEPVIQLTPELAGDYRIEIHDVLYRGSANHSYRLEVSSKPSASDSELPVLGPDQKLIPRIATQALPEIVNPEVDSNSILPGYINPRELLVKRETVRLKFPSGRTSLQSLPEAETAFQPETEPNNAPDACQDLALPGSIIGQLSDEDEVDYYRVAVKKGDQVWFQVFAERDGLPVDPFMQLEFVQTDANGKETAKPINVPDDSTTNLAPNLFDTVSDDIDFSTAAPEDGHFRVSIRRRNWSGSSSSAGYRLLVSQHEPEFLVYAHPLANAVGALTLDTPVGCVARRGGTTQLQVMVNRIRGFNQGIIVEAQHVPPGVEISKVLIPPGKSTGILTVYAAPDAPIGTSELSLQARSFDPAKPLTEAESQQVQRVIPVSVVWKSANNLPAVSRMGHTIPMAVISETSEFTPSAKPTEIAQQVFQSQLVWQEVAVNRQESFKEALTLKASAFDKNSKIKVDAPAIAKDKSNALLRFQFPGDAQPGWHVTQLTSEATLQYVRLPELVAKTAEQSKQAQSALEEGKKKQAELTEAQKKLQESTKQLEQEKVKLEAEVKNLQAQVDQLNQSRTKIEADLKAAADESAKKPLQQKLDEESKKVETETKKLEELKKSLETTLQNQKKAQEELTAANAGLKQQTDMVAQLQKSADSAKKTADATANAQKPKATKQVDSFGTLVFHVLPAPFQLSLKSESNLKVKAGQSIDVDVMVKRPEGQTFPVELLATVPPGTNGVQWSTVKLAPDAAEGKLKITVAADAPKGKIDFCTIRGIQSEGAVPGAVDAIVSLTIE